MRKLALIGVLIVLLGTSANRAPFGGGKSMAAPAHSGISVLLYVNGSLGDLGFFDSAHAGVLRAQQTLGASVKVVQNPDSLQWQSQILALAGSQKYDVIILDASDAAINGAVKQVIAKYPKQKIIDFDDNSFTTGSTIVSSVSSIIYKQNEGSFLAGALAALVAESNLPYVSHKKVLGMVGGMKIPVIIDFQDGYVQGAKAVDPNIDVKVTFIGGDGSDATWNNKPAGARLASALYNQGASVIFQVAGGSGLGVLSQSKIAGRYAIGVDTNQDAFAPGHVIGSMVKRVDNSLFDLIQLEQQGKLQGGHTYCYGLQNHGVDLTRDTYTQKIITPAMYSQLDTIAAKVRSGAIKVKSEYHC